jgi:ribose 5-phosphate isomerase B
MRIGIAADHEAFELKQELVEALSAGGHDVIDFGAYSLDFDDDYTEFVIPLGHAVASGDVERGIALCSNTLGASMCGNKIPKVRAGTPFDNVSVWQGVEKSHMNVICVDTRIVGRSVAWDLIQTFLAAQFRDSKSEGRKGAQSGRTEDSQRQ